MMWSERRRSSRRSAPSSTNWLNSCRRSGRAAQRLSRFLVHRQERRSEGRMRRRRHILRDERSAQRRMLCYHRRMCACFARPAHIFGGACLAEGGTCTCDLIRALQGGGLSMAMQGLQGSACDTYGTATCAIWGCHKLRARSIDCSQMETRIFCSSLGKKEPLAQRGFQQARDELGRTSGCTHRVGRIRGCGVVY